MPTPELSDGEFTTDDTPKNVDSGQMHVNNNVSESEDDDSETARITPLPKMQLVIVLLSQTAEPVTATVIYPFINKLVQEIGITHGDDRKTGYYAGMIESLFFVAELLTVVLWAHASDVYGRKPVIIIGLTGLGLSILAFGMSTHFWMLVLSRFCQGTFVGNMGVAKTVMAEITDPSNMSEAFGYLPLVWASGSTVGPIIGGLLSEPAIQHPDTIGKIHLFKRFPYLLPCMVAALIPLVLSIWQVFALKETAPAVLKSRKKQAQRNAGGACEAPLLQDGDVTADYGTVRQTSTSNDTTKPTARPSIRLLLDARVLKTLLNVAFVTLVESCYFALLPLVYSTPIPLGGLGLSPFAIGSTLATVGFFNGLFQVLLFARIERILGVKKLYIVTFSSMMMSIGAYPTMSWFARRAGRVDGFVWSIIAVQGICYIMISMTYGCANILVVDAAPSPQLLGLTNGFSQMASAAMRVIGPFSASSLFSLSLEHNLMGGRLVYWILLSLVALGIGAAFMLPEDRRVRGRG